MSILEPDDRPLVSVILVNFNRKDEVCFTLERLAEEGYPRTEVLVIDNASTDGSVEAVRARFPEVVLIPLAVNRGTEGRNVGLEWARGDYVLMLDSDSYPVRGSIERMVRHFEREPTLGAAAFRPLQPDGRDEPGASHNVFIGCGVGFRTRVLREIGGYPRGFGPTGYVEEYDLSFRLIQRGYAVRYFEDLAVHHRKSPVQRNIGRTIRDLVRNNLYLYCRYFPLPEAFSTLHWTLRRYWNVARAHGVPWSFWKGIALGIARALPALFRPALSDRALEELVPGRFCARRLREVAREHGARTVALWGIGKDFAALVRAVRGSGMDLVGAFVGTPGREAFAGRTNVLGVPVLPEEDLARPDLDAVIIGSASPGETKNELALLRGRTNGTPVLALFLHGEPADTRI